MYTFHSCCTKHQIALYSLSLFLVCARDHAHVPNSETDQSQERTKDKEHNADLD